MPKIEQPDIDSEISQDLKDEQLMAMNRHFKNRKSNRSSKLSPEMQALYKQALYNVIFGEFEQASKKLKSLIAIYPDHPDSFHLLATIHQQLGQNDKAVEYFFMHTYLSPPSLQKWVKVADMSFDLKMYTQAAYCYGRALKIQNYNIQLLTKRAEAFELSYQSKKAISTYKKILSTTQSLPVLKKYAKLRFKRGQYESSRQILISYEKHQHDSHMAYMVCQTYLKQQKYSELLGYIQGYIKYEQQKHGQFSLQNLLLQFIKLIYLCLIKLNKACFEPLDNINIQALQAHLIKQYDESDSVLYQDLVQLLKDHHKYCFEILEVLIKHTPHKTVENYLLFSQHLKQNKKYQQAICLLNQGLGLHSDSVQLGSQLNHLKVISGKWKQSQKQFVPKKSNPIEDQIFYSDQQPSQPIKKPFCSRSFKKQLQTEDPHILKKLFLNCQQTLASIVSELSSNIILNTFKQVQECVEFIITLTSTSPKEQKQQKQGLFNRRHRKRRYFSSKQVNRQAVITQNLPIILAIVRHLITYLKALLKQEAFTKVKVLTQMLSKAYFFRWQSKSSELRTFKQAVYEIGLIACLYLQKYQTAIFYIRYLAHKNPDNCFYLLIVNYLIHNSHIKIGMNSMLGKFLHKPENDTETLSKQDMFIEESPSEPPSRKLSNFSNFSDFLKDNLQLNYLFGIQYMETGCFDLAISSFLKIINSCEGQIKKTIWLCLTSCFLQISSSRTCHSKLLYTNRSSYCLWQAMLNSKSDLQSSFNKARWLAQIRLNQNAISEFNSILSTSTEQVSEDLKTRSAYGLLCLYKQTENWEQVNRISQKYFNIEEEYQQNKEKTKFQ